MNHVIEKASDATYAVAGATTGIGLWTWLGENASQIGAIGVCIGIALGVINCGINWYYKHKASK